MKNRILLEAITKYILGLLIVILFIFIPAGTINYFNGWLFICLIFIPKNPKLLKSRLNVKEKEEAQKIVVLISGLMFIVGFIIAGLNHRFSWIILPNIVIIISSILFIIMYILYAEVLRENMYLSRTIEVTDNQKVIDTGLYSIVRHPMYTITIILFLTIPLILGSIYSFIIFLIYPIIIIKRINNEESVLEKELVGYKKYKNKVKYKLIPYIW